MTQQFNPPSWGGETTSKDYEMLMAGETPISAPISLVGHGMTGFNQELRDPVTMPYVVKENGRIRNRVRTVRPAEQTAQTFTLFFGNTLWSPALQRSRLNQIDCRTTLYANRLCAPDDRNGVAYIFEQTIINPPKRVNDFITIDDTTMAEWDAEARIERELILWKNGLFNVATMAAGVSLYAIDFKIEDCPSCSDGVYVKMVATGGDGTAAGAIATTDDRWSTITLVATTNIPATNVGTSVFTDGDVVLVGFADDPDFTAGATGGTVFSTDFMATAPTVDDGITEPIYGVGKFNGQYIAVGGAGGAAAKVYLSDDGIIWTAVVSGTLPATAALSALAIDDVAGVFYVTAENGKFLKGESNGGIITFTDLTSLLPGSPGDLMSVRVFNTEHIAVGGAAGYYAESFDAGVTWTTPNVPGTAAIKAIGGNHHRSYVGAAAVVYDRSLFNQFNYGVKTPENGYTITGNVTGFANPKNDPNNALNYAAVVTDDGEFMIIRPFYPNS